MQPDPLAPAVVLPAPVFRRRPLVIKICLVSGLVVSCAQIVPIAAPTIRALLRLQPGALGWLLSSWMGLGIVGSIAGGWLADRGHARATLAGAALAIAAGYGICALPPSYPMYVAGMALSGVANAAVFAVANAVLAQAFPEGARRALTWLLIAIAAAGVAWPPAWSWLIDALANSRLGTAGAMQAAFGMAAVGALATLFLIAAIRPPAVKKAEERADEANGTPRAAFFGWPLVIVAAFASLHSASDNGAFLWLTNFVAGRFSPSPFPAAWILSGYSAAYFVGRLAIVNLPERWDNRTIVAIAAGGGALFFLLAFQAPNQYLLAGLYVVGGLFLAVDFPSILALIGKLFPHAPGRALSVALAVSQGVSVLIPPLMGYTGELTGSMRVGMVIPSVMLATLSMLALGWRLGWGKGKLAAVAA